MIRTTVMIAALAIAPPSLAQVRAIVADFDIAGVRLGMSVVDARAALAKAGYRISNSGTVLSFEQDVAHEAARRQGKTIPWTKPRGASTIMATGPHQEYVEVRFFQRPGGPRVASVSITVPRENMTSEAFKAQIIGKYGAPQATRSAGHELYWCSPQVARVCGVPLVTSGPRDDSQPRLFASVSESRLHLQAGTEAEQLFAREREAAIERLAPKAGKAAL